MAATQTSSTIASGSAGSGQPFNPDEWAPEIEVSARDFRVIANRVRQFTFTGPADALNIPVIGTITAADFTAAMEEGNLATIVYSLPVNSNKVITPGMSYAAAAIADRELRHSKYDLESAYQDELGEALAQKEDQDIVRFFQNAAFTNTQLGSTTSNYSEALLLSQLQSVVTNAKNKAKLNSNLTLVYHSAQIDDLLAITGLVSRDFTGDDAAKTGILKSAFGFDFAMSDNVFVSAGAAYQPLLSREALAMARLYVPQFRQQWAGDNIGWKLVAWQEFGFVALNPTAATIVITKST
jgi:capsid protein